MASGYRHRSDRHLGGENESRSILEESSLMASCAPIRAHTPTLIRCRCNLSEGPEHVDLTYLGMATILRHFGERRPPWRHYSKRFQFSFTNNLNQARPLAIVVHGGERPYRAWRPVRSPPEHVRLTCCVATADGDRNTHPSRCSGKASCQIKIDERTTTSNHMANMLQ